MKDIRPRIGTPTMRLLAPSFFLIALVLASCPDGNAQRAKRHCNLSINSFVIIRHSIGNYTFRFQTTCPAIATVSFGDQPPVSLSPPEFRNTANQNGVLIPGFSEGLRGDQRSHNLDADLSSFSNIDYYIVTVLPETGAAIYKTGRLSAESVPDVTTKVSNASTVAAVSSERPKKKYSQRPTAPTSYEMRCRGGAPVAFSTSQGQQLPTGETMMIMAMNFLGGTQGVDRYATNLQPGQCSWIDRGLRPGEPTELRLQIVSFAQLKKQLHGDPVDTSPTAAERYPDAQNVPVYLKDTNHYWSFFVYNTDQGYFQITSNKFWRPLQIVLPPRQGGGSGRRAPD